ncbi:MAG: hypothetical protein ACJATI_001053 [Halioglobus sp.]|jgi:hypothetical protein
MSNSTNNLILKNSEGLQSIPFDEIIKIEAASNYSVVYTDCRQIVFAKTLKYIEKRLPNNFRRIHRSRVVNIDAVNYIKKSMLITTCGTVLKMSRRKMRSIAFLILLFCFSINIFAQNSINSTYGNEGNCDSLCTTNPSIPEGFKINIPIKFYKSEIGIDIDQITLDGAISHLNQNYDQQIGHINFLQIGEIQSISNIDSVYCEYKPGGDNCDCNEYDESTSSFYTLDGIAESEQNYFHIFLFDTLFFDTSSMNTTPCYVSFVGNSYYPKNNGSTSTNFLLVTTDKLVNEDGRVLAHELGHLLGLYHTFEDKAFLNGGCSEFDGINDTEDTNSDCDSNTGNLMDYGQYCDDSPYSEITELWSITQCQYSKMIDIIFNERSNLCSNPLQPDVQIESGLSVNSIEFDFPLNFNVLSSILDITSATNKSNYAEWNLKNINGQLIYNQFSSSFDIQTIYYQYSLAGEYILEVRDSSIYNTDCVSQPTIVTINFPQCTAPLFIDNLSMSCGNDSYNAAFSFSGNENELYNLYTSDPNASQLFNKSPGAYIISDITSNTTTTLTIQNSINSLCLKNQLIIPPNCDEDCSPPFLLDEPIIICDGNFYNLSVSFSGTQGSTYNIYASSGESIYNGPDDEPSGTYEILGIPIGTDVTLYIEDNANPETCLFSSEVISPECIDPCEDPTINSITTSCFESFYKATVSFSGEEGQDYDVYAADSEGNPYSGASGVPSGTYYIDGIPFGSDINVVVENIESPFDCNIVQFTEAPDCGGEGEPYISVSWPSQSGQSVNVGQDVIITWANSTDIQNVKIEYCFDDDLTECNLIIASTDADGSYNWQVPNQSGEGFYKVKISNIVDNEPSAVGPSFFIDDQCYTNCTEINVTALTPNNGEIFEPGIVNLEWCAGGCEIERYLVRESYSFDMAEASVYISYDEQVQREFSQEGSVYWQVSAKPPGFPQGSWSEKYHFKICEDETNCTGQNLSLDDDLIFPDIICTGQNIEVSAEIKNDSDLPYYGTISAYLGSVSTSQAQFIQSYQNEYFAPGQTKAFTFQGLVTVSGAPDMTLSISETDSDMEFDFVLDGDGDNILPIEFDDCGEEGEDDFFITTPTVSNLSPEIGEEVYLSCFQNNAGGSSNVANVIMHYVVSIDQATNANDIVIGADQSTLSVYQNSEFESGNFTIPAVSPGTYFIRFCADASEDYTESNENNNCESIEIQILSSSSATQFIVNSSLDTSDDLLGDGICDDGNGNCTLRAALEESNSNANSNTILFESDITSLDFAADDLDIVYPVTIDGGSTGIVTIDGNGLNQKLEVYTDNFNIYGLHFTNFSGEAIYISDASNITIGGPDNGCMFTNCLDGLFFDGIVNNVTIEGNYFGTNTSFDQNLGNSKGNIWTSQGGLFTNWTIGGNFNSDKSNYFANAGNACMLIQSEFSGNIIGNFIGTDNSQTIDLANTNGIWTTGGTIGGSFETRNIFKFNSGDAIRTLDMTPTTISYNVFENNDDAITFNGNLAMYAPYNSFICNNRAIVNDAINEPQILSGEETQVTGSGIEGAVIELYTYTNDDCQSNNYAQGNVSIGTGIVSNGTWIMAIDLNIGDQVVALQHDGSETSFFTNAFTIIESGTIGCMDELAHNYNPNATEDSGNCLTCFDGIQNGDEEWIDCGGVLCNSCPPPCPDLIVTSIGLKANGTFEGTIKNIGNDTAFLVNYNVGIQYYLSKDSIFLNDNDIPSGGWGLNTTLLPSEQYYWNLGTVNQDSLCKYPYVFGHIDNTNTLEECIENNNIAFSLEGPCGCLDPSAHNYDPIATTTSNYCETCDDGIKNGDEIGTDCGGDLCSPCTYVECDYEYAGLITQLYEGSTSIHYANDKIYSTFAGEDVIRIFDLDGSLLNEFGELGSDAGQFNFNTPANIHIGSNNKLYVPDSGNDRIQVFDADGNFDFSFEHWSVDGPRGIDIDNDTVYITSWYPTRISLFTLQGDFIDQYYINNSLGFPSDIEVFDNILYVTRGLDKIYKYSKTGQQLDVITAPFQFTSGIEIIDSMNLFVTDPNQELLHHLDVTGVYHQSFTSDANGLTKINDLIIANNDVHFYQYSPCGAIIGCLEPESHNYNPLSEIESCETCYDGVLNGDETEIDCGGNLCPPCYLEPEFVGFSNDSITIDYFDVLDIDSSETFTVNGDVFGAYNGVFDYNDGMLSFSSNQEFVSGEVLHVSTDTSMYSNSGESFGPKTWNFQVPTTNTTDATFTQTFDLGTIPLENINEHVIIFGKDINGDEYVDIVVKTSDNENTFSTFYTFIYDAVNGFYIKNSLVQTLPEISSVLLSDLNKDGFMDMCFTHSENKKIEIKINNGSGQFISEYSYTHQDSILMLISADINANGKHDIIFSDAEGKVYAAINNNNEFEIIEIVDNVLPIKKLILSDLDSDGDQDLIINSLNQVSIYENHLPLIVFTLDSTYLESLDILGFDKPLYLSNDSIIILENGEYAKLPYENLILDFSNKAPISQDLTTGLWNDLTGSNFNDLFVFDSDSTSSQYLEIFTHNSTGYDIVEGGFDIGNSVSTGFVDMDRDGDLDLPFVTIEGKLRIAINGTCTEVGSNLDMMIPGSLRFAIECSNPGDTITFTKYMNGQTIPFDEISMMINKELTIYAPSDLMITITRGSDGVLVNVMEAGDLTLQGIKLKRLSISPLIENSGLLTLKDVYLLEDVGLEGVEEILLNLNQLKIIGEVYVQLKE